MKLTDLFEGKPLQKPKLSYLDDAIELTRLTGATEELLIEVLKRHYSDLTFNNVVVISPGDPTGSGATLLNMMEKHATDLSVKKSNEEFTKDGWTDEDLVTLWASYNFETKTVSLALKLVDTVWRPGFVHPSKARIWTYRNDDAAVVTRNTFLTVRATPSKNVQRFKYVIEEGEKAKDPADLDLLEVEKAFR